MPVAETLLTVGALAGKEGLKKAVESTYSVVSEKTQKVLKKIKNEREIGHLYSHLSKVRRVKTLGQLDKAVDLMTFYCPSHIISKDKEKRKRISTLDDFATEENVLVEGIAGQGKSIFLRYLASVELVKGDVIPVFIELRHINQRHTLLTHIVSTLREFRIDADGAIFEELANSGRLLLLLDAFDEVTDAAKAKVLFDIESLMRRHEKLRIVITSRPDSGIAACPHFEVVRLSDLQGKEFEAVISKLLDDVDLATQLVKQVHQHKGGIRELLLTPLLVTLLVIRYKSYQELPEQLSDFYDSLFQLLLQRHDGVKPGYKRPRNCTINDYQYRNGFEALCFFAKKLQGQKLDHPTIYRISEDSLKDRQINEDADKFLSDIVKITCLVVKDGEEYRFIHKSVQEYYAASYIRQKPNVVLEKLYSQLFAEPKYWQFEQELRFLNEIDTYRINKFGVLPYLRALFKVQDNEFLANPSPAHHSFVRNHILDNFTLTFAEEDENVRPVAVSYARLLPLNFDDLTTENQRILDSLLHVKYPKSVVAFKSWPLCKDWPMDGGAQAFRCSLRQVLASYNLPKVVEALNESCKKWTEVLFQIARKAVKRIEFEENTENVLTLD